MDQQVSTMDEPVCGGMASDVGLLSYNQNPKLLSAV
jgi:hypothetical protein